MVYMRAILNNSNDQQTMQVQTLFLFPEDYGMGVGDEANGTDWQS